MAVPVANQTWLIATPNTSGVNVATSAQYPLITTWSGATAYSVGAIVTNPGDGLQYQAVVANTNIAPPSPGTWTRSAYTTPDKGMLAVSAVPLPFVPVWDPATAFAPGAVVAYGANRFTTPTGSQGQVPPATPDNNTAWEYVGGAGPGYGASFYVAGSPYTASVYAGIEWYDQGGALIAAPGGMNAAGSVIALPCYQRLAGTTAEMNATTGNTLGLSWTANPTGFWQIASGALVKNPAWSGAQKIKLLYVNDTRADCCVGITAQSEVTNSAVEDNGILFRLSDTSNYWMCSRQKVQKVVAGTLSTVASYSRLPVGSRWYVQAVGSTIKVYAYPGASAAPVLVATITDSFNSTATRHGLYDQVF